jgi:uncharacterized membrane protein YphA (DoxX/SURF4 family)
VISRKVPWKRSELDRARQERPWGPQVLALVVLVLALIFLYHGTVGRQLLTSLDAYLGGQAPTLAAPAAPKVDGQGGVDGLQNLLTAMVKQVKAGDWNAASQSLGTLEENWLALQGEFSRAGVRAQDLNAVTADISELALALAAKNGSDALAQISATQRELSWITANYLSNSAPTMDQMATVIQDLQKAVTARDWTRVQEDAHALAVMMAAVQRGF